MATRATFMVEVALERTEGKFASREEILEAVTEWLDGANEGSVDGIGADGDSTYEVTDWEVSEMEKPKVAKAAMKR